MKQKATICGVAAGLMVLSVLGSTQLQRQIFGAVSATTDIGRSALAFGLGLAFFVVQLLLVALLCKLAQTDNRTYLTVLKGLAGTLAVCLLGAFVLGVVGGGAAIALRALFVHQLGLETVKRMVDVFSGVCGMAAAPVAMHLLLQNGLYGEGAKQSASSIARRYWGNAGLLSAGLLCGLALSLLGLTGVWSALVQAVPATAALCALLWGYTKPVEVGA